MNKPDESIIVQTIIALAVSLVLALTPVLIPSSFAENTDQGTFQSNIVADHILVGKVKNIESRWNDDRTSIYSYVTISAENWLTEPRQDKEVIIKYIGGEVDGLGSWRSDQPSFSKDEKVKVFLKLEETGEFTVVGGRKGKISLSYSASSGYSYSGIHWHSNSLPVKYYINELGTPDTTDEFTAVQTAFQTWEDDPGSYMDYTYMGTTTKSSASRDGSNIVFWGYIDGLGGDLANCNVWYYVSSKEIVEFDIVFDEAETWVLPQFDVQNVATHEVGHTLSLDDLYDAADSEETMYGYADPGETKKRNLNPGDIAGIRHIYPGTIVTYTIATDILGLNVEVDGDSYASPQSFSWYPTSTHTINAPSPQSGDTGVRYVYTSWSDGGAKSHTITAGASDSTITAAYKTQYYLTVSSLYGVVGGSNWYDSGSTTHATLSTGMVNHNNGTRRIFTSWSGDASGTNYAQSDAIIMDGPKNAVAEWKTQYEVTFVQSGLDFSASDVAFIVVGSDKTFDDFPFNVWVDSGSSITYSYNAIVSSTITGKRFKLASVTGPTSPFTATGKVTISGEYQTQHQISLKFVAANSEEIYPDKVTIFGDSPNDTLTTLTSYSNVWLDNVEWTAKEILWMSNNVVLDPNPRYSPAIQGTWTVHCRVHLIAFATTFKDSHGAALYTGPLSFSLVCPNGTTTPPLMIGSYYLQNGTYQWKTIVWRGIDVLPSPQAAFDPTDDVPEVHCLVYSLTVNIKDYFNLAVSGADVRIYSTDGTMFTSGKSSSGGQITFSQLPINDYKVEAAFLGLKASTNLSLKSDKSADMRLFLSVPMLLIVIIMLSIPIGGILAIYLKRKSRTNPPINQTRTVI